MLGSSRKKFSLTRFFSKGTPTVSAQPQRGGSEHNIKFLMRCKAVLLTMNWYILTLSLPFPPDMVMTRMASLASVLLDLWQTVFHPTHNVLFIDHSVYWFIFTCIICSGYLMAHRQDQNYAGFSLHCYYKKLLASVEAVLSFYWSQLNGLGSHRKLKVWVERHTAQQCLNQKCFGLGGCLHPKPNPCLMGSHSKRPPLTFPHGDKAVLPPEEERN